MSAAIKAGDNAMLFREAEELVPHLGEMMATPDENTPRVQCWTPKRAKKEFLYRFKELSGTTD